MSSSMKAKTEKLPPAGLPPGTTLDDFLGGRIAVAQPKAGHRAGAMQLWLQAAVPHNQETGCSMPAQASGLRGFACLPVSVKST